jgi:hypothetical protein
VSAQENEQQHGQLAAATAAAASSGALGDHLLLLLLLLLRVLQQVLCCSDHLALRASLTAHALLHVAVSAPHSSQLLLLLWLLLLSPSLLQLPWAAGVSRSYQTGS